MFKKFLAGAVAVAAFTTGLATPASAGPADGEGCAGFPSLPDTYVCVISVTPQNAVPTTTTSLIPVTVPRFCYVAGCTGPTTVNVPVPGVQPGSGVVATLWYKGQYIPIAAGQVPGVPPLTDTNALMDFVYDVSWVPFILVFGSEQGWFNFLYSTSNTVCGASLGTVCVY